MDQACSVTYTAFEGERRIASGELASVVLETKRVMDRGTDAQVLIFNDTSSEQVEVDFRGTDEDVLERLAARSLLSAPAEASTAESQETPAGPGRPKLGVVAREVTLLPRHWEWLNSQPGGASVALRKLVDQARRDNQKTDQIRLAQESTYRFMSTMAGDLPGFEEACRALFAKNSKPFYSLIASWPEDVKDHTSQLASRVFEEDAE